MKIFNIILLLLTFISCTNKNKKETVINKKETVIKIKDTVQSQKNSTPIILKDKTIKDSIYNKEINVLSKSKNKKIKKRTQTSKYYIKSKPMRIEEDTVTILKNRFYKIPKEIDINNYLTKKRKSNNTYNIEPFYVIGWSTSGNFAYITEPDTEAAGAYVFKIIIKNLTNKIVWQWEFNQLEEENWKDESLETIWKRNTKLFNQKLNEFEIVQVTNVKIKKTPLYIHGKTYVLYEEQTKQINKFFSQEELSKINISFNEIDKEKKIVYSTNFNNGMMILHAEVIGVFISPNTHNFAILNTTVERGWEGPPHIISEQVILGSFK